MPIAVVAKLIVVNNILWIIIVNITKVSILIQYLRVFSNHITRVLCIILMMMVLPAACWGIFGGTFLCSPPAKLWNPSLPGHCMSAPNYWYSVAAIDIGMDFLVLLLPLPAIVALRLPRKQKFGLLCVFLLGFFVCVVSFLRLLTVLITSIQGNRAASGLWAIIWSAVEANVGIVCASLLALKPLAVKIFPSLAEETKPPRHSIQLPMIEAGVWPRESHETNLSYPQSANVPATPRTMRSKESCYGKWSTSSRQAFGQGFCDRRSTSGPEDLDRIETAESSPRAQERLSIFDILQEDVDEAQRRARRTDSTALQ